jgi:hypothetical protein
MKIVEHDVLLPADVAGQEGGPRRVRYSSSTAFRARQAASRHYSDGSTTSSTGAAMAVSKAADPQKSINVRSIILCETLATTFT